MIRFADDYQATDNWRQPPVRLAEGFAMLTDDETPSRPSLADGLRGDRSRNGRVDPSLRKRPELAVSLVVGRDYR